MAASGFNDCFHSSRHILNKFFETSSWDPAPGSHCLCPQEALLVFFALKLEDIFYVKICSCFGR